MTNAPRNDLVASMPRKVLVIGSGPIIIGQAAEFDYAGTQACRALREEGAEVVLVNSNPATIMTDPSLSSATYIEPITPDFVSKIINSPVSLYIHTIPETLPDLSLVISKAVHSI